MQHFVPKTFRLSRIQKWLIVGSVSLMTFTGFAWIVVQVSFADETARLGVLPLLQWLIRLHVAAALISLIAFGTLWVNHVPSGWRQPINKRTGISNLSSWIALSVTGYLLWYGPQGASREWIAWSHWALGLVLPLSLLMHTRRYAAKPR
jgi:hypothetical protein